MLIKSLKILHTLGAIGLTGAVAVHLILLGIAPDPEAIQEYAVIRGSIAAIANWLLLPSLAVVFLSGLLSMALYAGFRQAGWVWIKGILSFSIFSATLAFIHGNAMQTAAAAEAAAAGRIGVDEIPRYVNNEPLVLWVVLIICIANVVLGVWRPRWRSYLDRPRRSVDAEQGGAGAS
ncbi:DUF2269 family protein [Halorhodospira halophila]|uniref:DUF2269 domain-containing protein n=1 Tax=Halorhodospira halophila (strain DSM 244 / SL1) TaxID=349124 RepID=A1WU09_HALHL|nr:DUF2269 family protein [Halorhodospira halophila]ABM61171.1 hypothetical protein Hhal_0377 [Halorhodospira halophila SL1]MBK1729636.1 DUF2269 domain-containing protein [Halorhodospira halophila]